MDKVVDKTLKLGYYYYSLVKICGILWLAKQIHQSYTRGYRAVEWAARAKRRVCSED